MDKTLDFFSHTCTKLCWVLVLALCASVHCFAQNVYNTEHILDARDYLYPKILHYADMDNDGLEDVVVVCSEPRMIFVKKQLPNGEYGDLIEIDNIIVTWLELVDLDNDGLLDLLFLRGGSVRWINNLGNNEYSDSEVIYNPYNTCQIKVGDFNNNGSNDIILCYVEEVFINNNGFGPVMFWTSLVLLSNDGSGNWDDDSIYENFLNEELFLNFSGSTLDIGDVDADGDLDIIFSGYTDSINKLYYAENTGDFTFQVDEYEEILGDHLSLRLMDLDLDGDLDIVSNTLEWLSNDADGLFTNSGILLNADFIKSDWQDFDGDGVKDLITLESDNFSWRKKNSDLSFGDPQDISSFIPEIFTTVTSSDETVSRFLVYNYDDGLGLLEPSEGTYDFQNFGLNGVRNVSDFAVLDLDGDGDMDIICSKENSVGLSYFLNEGMGVYGEEISVSNAVGNLLGIETHLINDDELEDIVFHTIDKIGYQINNGDGTFGEPILDTFYYGAGGPVSTIRSIAVDDLNLNGIPDLLVNGQTDLKWFYDFTEAGGLTQSNCQAILDAGLYGGMELHDLDGDGLKDVIGGTSLYNLWYRNTGTSFVFQDIPINLGLPIQSTSIVDFNSDGSLDFVIQSNQLKVLLNNGNAESFEEIDIETNVLYSGKIKRLDINGDGKLDLIAYSENAVHWAQAITEDTFHVSKEMINAAYNSELAAPYFLDMEGDGDYDLISLEFVQEKLSWHEFNPDNPIAAFLNVTDGGNNCDLDSVQFFNVSVAYFANCTWEWDFDDGNTSTEFSPKHFYEAAGSYQPELTICNQNGCSSSSKTVQVEVELLVEPEYDIPSEGVVGESILFEDNTLEADNWTWVFGDGEVSTEQAPVHTYDEAGTYTVELYITNSNFTDCTHYFTETITISAASAVNSIRTNESEVGPNPFVDFVDVFSFDSVFITYRLYNLNGEELSSGNLNTERIYMPNLAKGVYLLELTEENGNSSFTRLVK